MQQKKLLEEQTEKQQAAAKAKKQKMKEIEAERRLNMPPTEAEMEKTVANEALKARVGIFFKDFKLNILG